MRVALPDWTALALFAGLVLSASLFGLALSAHFPREHRRDSLRGHLGGAILWGSCVIVGAALLLAIRLAVAALPGYAAVMAGGAAVLIAPLLLKPLPDSLIDDRGGLLLFAGIAALLAWVSVGY